MKSFYTDSALRSEYYRDHCFAVDLVYIGLANSNNVIDSSSVLRLCTGGIDVVWNTDTYTAQGDFLGFSGMSEDFDVKVGKFTIYISGLGTGYISKFTATEVEGKRVTVYKAFLNLNTLEIVSTPILMFDGTIYNVAITEASRSCQINIDCSSLFADFERTAGRKTNNWSNWLYQGQQYDTAFEKSGYVGNSEFKWGRL